MRTGKTLLHNLVPMDWFISVLLWCVECNTLHQNEEEKMPRQSIELPVNIKEGLDKMATTFGMTQNALINLAVTTMVVKYDAEGTRIFFDLISPPIKRK